MRLFLAIACLVTFTGCTKGSNPVCETAKAITVGVAAEIANQLQCSNVDAIKATLEQKLIDLKVCKEDIMSNKSLIGEMICPTLVNSVMTGITSQIPPAWGCSGGTIKDDLKQYLLTACKNSI